MLQVIHLRRTVAAIQIMLYMNQIHVTVRRGKRAVRAEHEAHRGIRQIALSNGNDRRVGAALRDPRHVLQDQRVEIPHALYEIMSFFRHILPRVIHHERIAPAGYIAVIAVEIGPAHIHAAG